MWGAYTPRICKFAAMKNFKRIIDATGQVRYYVNGRRITTSAGAKKYVAENLPSLTPEQLSPTELRSYRGKLAAQKNASKIASRYRFRGRFVDRVLQKFMEAEQLLPKGQTSINREFPAVRDYGEFIKELERMFPETLARGIEMDDGPEWITPNRSRARTDFENILDIQEVMEKRYSNYNLNVLDENGNLITDRNGAYEAIREWENEKAREESNKGSDVAFLRFNHRIGIDLENKTITIDLSKSKAEVKTSP